MKATPLTVRGIGLVTSVGLTAAASAAAARAGIVRTRPIDGLAGGLDGDTETEVAGHPIRGLTNGFEQTGRWLQMTHAALHDLAADTRTSIDAPEWETAALLPVLPHPERFGWPTADVPRIVEETFVDRLRQLTGIRAAFRQGWCSFGGNGLISAVALGRSILAERQAERLLVIAVDSLLDSISLRELVSQDRLKAAETPNGSMPGEGSACVVLDGLADDGGTSLLETDVDGATEAPVLESDDPLLVANRRGIALAKLVDSWPDSVVRTSATLDAHPNLNGEEWRTHAWTAFRQALRSRPRGGHWSEVLAASSFGDTGAASPLISVCLAECARRRGRAAQASLVATFDDDGAAGAIALSSRSQ